MTDLIERAKAVAERLELGKLIEKIPDNWGILVSPNGTESMVNFGGGEIRQYSLDSNEAAAIIRELIAQIKPKN